MSARPPSFTALVVTRDRPRLLADALAGIARQQAAPLEVRIADDGILPLHEAVGAAGLLEVTLVKAGVGQAGAARNLAACGARGEVLALLDDDDRWLPGHLAGLATAFQDPAVDIAYRDCAVVREEIAPDGARIELERVEIARDWEPETMRHDDYLPPSAWGVRRTLFEQLGGFDERFRFSEDWDFLLRAAALTLPRRVPGVSVEVRLRGPDNASADRGEERRDCLARLASRHGLAPLEVKTFWEVALALGGVRVSA